MAAERILLRHPGQATESLTESYLYTTGGWLLKAVSPDPSRGSTINGYNNVGEVISTTDAVTNVTQCAYDFAGRKVLTTLPDGSKRKTIVDAGTGRPIAQQELSAANAVLRTNSVTYDANGNVLSATDGRGTVQSFSYDALGRVTQAVQPISATDSITASFGYDANGSRTRFTDGRNNTFRTTYNSWNLPEAQVDPGNSTFLTAYDSLGRVDNTLSPGGVRLTNHYDLMSNLTSVTGTGAEVSTVDKTYGYDSLGRVTSVSGSGGSNNLTYDDRGLPTSVTGPSGNSSFSWTADGLLASRTDAAATTSYTYDAAGRLATAANSSAGLNLALTYNNLSQPSQITYGSNQNRRILGYDTLHRLESDELKTAAGTSIAKITYGWDANDNETSKTTTGFAGSSANTYTYDWADRIVSWNATVYAYDKSGNRTQAGGKTFTYDAANRLQSASDGTTYQYTARGTLSRTTVGTVSTDTLSDAFNQVTRQYSTATQYSDYSYDGFGRVFQAGFAYSGTGNDLAADPAATYIRGPGGELLGSKTGANATYAWTDLHTDVVAQFTATGTTLAGSTTYEPFGKVTATGGTQGNLGYQSAWTDPQTKRVNMHARWYNTDTGQFDSRDTTSQSPLPASINANRFAYANANPLTRVDPTGHASDVTGGGGWSVDPAENEEGLDPCRRSADWYYRHGGGLAPPCVTSPTRDVNTGNPGFPGRTGNTVNGCAHGNYDWIFENCTGVGTYNGGNFSCVADVTHEVEMCFTKEQMGGVSPVLFGSELDLAVGRRGGYGDDPTTAQILMGVVLQQAINVAAQRQADLDQRNTDAKSAADCQASWACRNAGWVGTVVGAVAGTIAGAVCLAVTAGAGSIFCGALGGLVGGFVGSLTTGAMQGKHGAELWVGAAIDGLIGAAVGLVTLGLGAGLGVLIRKGLGTVAGQAFSGAIRSSVSNAGAKLANTALGRITAAARGLVAKAEEKFGKCTVATAAQAVTAGASAAATAHSFSPDTEVLMADGTTKALKDIKVGDEVTATDPTTEQTTAQLVTALHVNLDNDLIDVTVSLDQPEASERNGVGNGDRSTRGPTATLHTTDHHPFWDSTAKQWVNAAQLRPGNSTLVGPDGQTVHVTALHEVVGVKQMRDLTVAALHTYYVVAGNTPVLVHNCGEKYVTYTKTHPETGQVYTGRSYGTGTPEQIVAARDAGHHMNDKGFGPAVLDQFQDATLPHASRHSDPAYQAIRGREQGLIDFFGGSQSDGGTSGNAIRGIAADNPLLDTFMNAANVAFGGSGRR
ncbi:RHS repeat-associated core domain-containing protein [Rhizocola hellebori]|uniref:RHS repeat-associated core domain-containing protein n=1 Tax=Rhizocola hellebori TaxID=1392758 RepID=UPI0019442C26|nr:RHS repeat-associated core domain-containing protein [Rhizocola hellebori]